MRGFPPTPLQSGTRDLFLSNAVRLHSTLRAAGVAADPHVFEVATHITFLAGPEQVHRSRMVRAFVDRIWSRAAERLG